MIEFTNITLNKLRFVLIPMLVMYALMTSYFVPSLYFVALKEI